MQDSAGICLLFGLTENRRMPHLNRQLLQHLITCYSVQVLLFWRGPITFVDEDRCGQAAIFMDNECFRTRNQLEIVSASRVQLRANPINVHKSVILLDQGKKM